jgi:hypothetical protein
MASFRALWDVGALLLNERDRHKALAIQIDFANKLIAAQTQASELLSAVIEQKRQIGLLDETVRNMKAHQAEKERYALAKVGTVGEFTAYRLRGAAELDERRDELPHFVCQPCFEAGTKRVLQGNGDGYWWCPGCNLGAQAFPGEPSGRRSF